MPIQARRHSPRVKLNEAAYINFGAGNRGVILDVSEGGLRFQAASPLETFDSLRVWLTSNRQSEGTAAIAWTDEDRTIGGLRFTTVPPEIRDQIRSWMTGAVEQGASENGDANLELDTLPLSDPLVGAEAADRRPVEFSAETLNVVADPASPLLNTEVPQMEAQAVEASDARAAVSRRGIGGRGNAASEREESAIASATMPDGESDSDRLEMDDHVANPVLSAASNASASVNPANSLSMFPSESAQSESYAYNAYTSSDLSPQRLAVSAVVVLFALAAIAGLAAYYYPNGVRRLMRDAQAKVANIVSPSSKQPSSNAEPAAMGGPSLTAEPGFAGNVPSGSAPITPTPNAGVAPEGGSPAGPITPQPVAPSSPAASGPSTSPSDTQSAADAVGPKEPNAAADATTKNNSQADVELAQTYLERGTTPDQKAKAVQLLWLATEKGNVDAEIELADLYARGDSVPKSCVQARILLKAASVANPTAAQPKIAELNDAGCS